jgi:hypothetical protein
MNHEGYKRINKVLKGSGITAAELHIAIRVKRNAEVGSTSAIDVFPTYGIGIVRPVNSARLTGQG